MKLVTVLLFISLSAKAQKFFVEPTEKGFEQTIVNKLRYENYILANTKEDSDVTLQCLVDGHYNAWKIGNMFHGYVRFINSKTGQELARTKEVGKSPAALNGFQAGPRIMQVIADKYLLPTARKVSASLAAK